MGKQCGALQLTGTHGGFNFYKLGDMFLWRASNPISKERFKKDEAFAKQRANSAEFGRCSAAVKQIRWAFKTQIRFATDMYHASRLQKVLAAITKAEKINMRGERRPELGPLEWLKGFEFNPAVPVNKLFPNGIVCDYDCAEGFATITIARFMPALDMQRPKSATHFRIMLGAAAFDFANKNEKHDAIETDLIPITASYTSPMSFVLRLTPGSALPVLIGAGVRFSEVVNGVEKEDGKEGGGFGVVGVLQLR